MASSEVIREAALYLEYFFKGLSECGVIGSYTVQFLDVHSFSQELKDLLVSHVLTVLANMKVLLKKLDASNFQDKISQTETPLTCRVCQKASLSQSACESVLPEPMNEKSFRSNFVSQCIQSHPSFTLKTERTGEEESESSENMPEVSVCLQDPIYAVIPNANSSDSGRTMKHAKEKLKSKDSQPVVGSDIEIKGEETDKVDEVKSLCSQTEKNSSLLPSMQMLIDDHMDLECGFTPSAQEEILLGPIGGTETEGLMYSVYTMNSCGSLQLVSRVLSKGESNSPLDQTIEKATIEITDGRVMDSTELSVKSTSDLTTVPKDKQEEVMVTPDLPQLGDRRPKVTSNQKGTTSRTTVKGTKGNIIMTDVVKLGPEDLTLATWCGICEQEFPTPGSLKHHLSRAHNSLKYCHTCSKSVNTDLELSQHVLQCHSDLPYICHVCGRNFKVKAYLIRHMDIHKGVRGSPCEVCGQTFSRAEYYEEHKRIHTGEKPFVCHFCNKSFSRSSNLYAHMKIHNTDASKRYACNLCNKSFARADKLKEHMIRHLQIKRFTCLVCSKAYSEKRDLNKHIDKVHRGQLHSVGLDNT